MRFFHEFIRHALSASLSSSAGIMEMYWAMRTLSSLVFARMPWGWVELKINRSPASNFTLVGVKPVVSGLNRSFKSPDGKQELSGLIQFDAAANPGNSGGPLFNLDGEVVGVNTAILSPNGGSIGIGFSMASNVVSRVVEQLTEYGEIRRGWLGVRIQDVDEDIAESIEGLDRAAGAVVTGVPEGPSKDAGILQGDVIVIFDGHEVEDVRDLVQTVGNTEVGKAVDVVVVRDGAQVTLSVTLGLRDDEKLARADAPEVNEDAPKDYEDLGITLSNLTDEIREGLDLAVGLEGVVVVDVLETSEAFEKGLKSGDVIVEAGQEKVTSLAEFEEQVSATIESGRKTMLLLVRRGGDPRFLALTVQQ